MEDRVRRNLGLHAGDWVEIRSAEEILATLDDAGRLDGLPFMPEMLRYCGQRVRVYKAAHKTCNTIDREGPSARRMEDAVHLEGLRCDGSEHGGCQAACLLFWKEAWLRPAPDEHGRVRGPRAWRRRELVPPRVCTETALREATTVRSSEPQAPDAPIRYSCQATELKRATKPLSEWSLGQYFRDITSGNTRLREFATPFLHWVFWKTSRWGGYRFRRKIYNALQTRCGGSVYTGDSPGKNVGRTPTGHLDLKPGEEVEILSHEEILETLDQNSKNRGLWFDEELAARCGEKGRVLSRVDRIINEATGEMMHFSNPCIVLENVFCRAQYTRGRYNCPRAIFAYWREIWLRRSGTPEDPAQESS